LAETDLLKYEWVHSFKEWLLVNMQSWSSQLVMHLQGLPLKYIEGRISISPKLNAVLNLTVQARTERISKFSLDGENVHRLEENPLGIKTPLPKALPLSALPVMQQYPPKWFQFLKSDVWWSIFPEFKVSPPDIFSQPIDVDEERLKIQGEFHVQFKEWVREWIILNWSFFDDLKKLDVAQNLPVERYLTGRTVFLGPRTVTVSVFWQSSGTHIVRAHVQCRAH
jgi:hypothetical protein